MNSVVLLSIYYVSSAFTKSFKKSSDNCLIVWIGPLHSIIFEILILVKSKQRNRDVQKWLCMSFSRLEQTTLFRKDLSGIEKTEQTEVKACRKLEMKINLKRSNLSLTSHRSFTFFSSHIWKHCRILVSSWSIL